MSSFKCKFLLVIPLPNKIKILKKKRILVNLREL